MPLSTFGADATASDNDDLRELMEEPPGGDNAGRVATSDPETHGRWFHLSANEVQAHEFLKAGGWAIFTPEKDGVRAGMTSHRTTLHEDEYVDHGAVLRAVEAHLGFTVADVQAVYRQGRLSASQGELRARIDARLLALSRAGGNMLALARLLGLRIRTNRPGGGDDCPVLSAALARARAAGVTA